MSALNEFKRLSGTVFVDGTSIASKGAALNVINPVTGKSLGHIADATADEVDAALVGAQKAQSEWWALSALERAEALHEAAHQMRIDRPLVAEMLTREMGKPYKESADEISWSITAMDYYAEIGRHEAGRVVGPAVAGQLHYTVKEPLEIGRAHV